MKTFLQIFFALSVLLIACSNPCDEVDCGLNGTCDEGICICELGYEGSACETEAREKFIGFWTTGNLACEPINSSAQLSYDLSPGDAANEIKITTPTTPDLLLIATVRDSSLTIAAQDLIFGVPVTYEGQGSLDASNKFTLTISQTAEDFVRTCEGTFRK